MEKRSTVDIHATLFSHCHTYQYLPYGDYCYTDGIELMSNLCNAHWLIDKIMSYQPALVEILVLYCQLWCLEKSNYTNEWSLTMKENSLGPTLIHEKIENCDFPLNRFEAFFSSNILMLPQEG